MGGGIVKGPLMLHMGVHPFVASATCAVMIMFTSVAATTMFIAFGTLLWDYGIFLFIIGSIWRVYFYSFVSINIVCLSVFVLGLLATVVGQFGVSYLVSKYRRVSLVSLSIGAVVALSTVLMAVQSIFSLLDARNGRTDSTSALCAS